MHGRCPRFAIVPSKPSESPGRRGSKQQRWPPRSSALGRRSGSLRRSAATAETMAGSGRSSGRSRCSWASLRRRPARPACSWGRRTSLWASRCGSSAVEQAAARQGPCAAAAAAAAPAACCVETRWLPLPSSRQAEIGSPDPDRPDCGRLLFGVECSPVASPAFRVRPRAQLGSEGRSALACADCWTAHSGMCSLHWAVLLLCTLLSIGAVPLCAPPMRACAHRRARLPRMPPAAGAGRRRASWGAGAGAAAQHVPRPLWWVQAAAAAVAARSCGGCPTAFPP